MSLRQVIKNQQILKAAISYEMELPGDPMIYSIKFPVGNRTRSSQYFRNKKWKSILKCIYKSYYQTKVPIVIIVKFFVKPPEYVKLTAAEVKSEKIPAVFAFELCDYLLSFMEILMMVLFNSYRQVVKVDAEKWYSARPRTTFRFMRYDHYVDIQNNNPISTKTKSKRSSIKKNK